MQFNVGCQATAAIAEQFDMFAACGSNMFYNFGRNKAVITLLVPLVISDFFEDAVGAFFVSFSLCQISVA